MSLRRVLGLALLALAAVPAGAPAADPPRVLIYSGTAGFRHQSIPIGNATLEQLGRETGRFEVVGVVEEPGALTPQRLGEVDAVLWNSTTGEASPFTDQQQAAYEQFVGCGGGHLGVHASADSYRDWPAWRELTGAFFASHPITPTSVADDDVPEEEGSGEPEATILVTDQASPVTSPWRGQDSFLLRDEFYALDGDPAAVIADFRPLLAFGGFSDPVVTVAFGRNYAPRQPLSWTGTFRGRNRLAYTNLGHSGRTWRREDFRRSLVEMVAFVGERRPAAACLVAAGLRPAPAKVTTLRGTSRPDRLRGTAGADRLVGLGGRDDLRGRAGDDRLVGGAGDDLLEGGPGADVLQGGTGDDRLLARDGTRDEVDCGAGRRDRAVVDAADVVRRCERVTRVTLRGSAR